MAPSNLISILFEKLEDAFTPDQVKVIGLLRQEGYSPVGSCRGLETKYRFDLAIFPTVIPVCDYTMLQNEVDTFIVGDINSIYYGSRKIDGVTGTLRMHCSLEDKQCNLKEIRDRWGKVLSTRELLKQLRQRY